MNLSGASLGDAELLQFIAQLSSFAYLRALAVGYVKIDQSFVKDRNPTNRALVQAVKSVATALGKGVIAEGVENEGHAATLVELGIELAHGYHCGLPEPDPFTRQRRGVDR